MTDSVENEQIKTMREFMMNYNKLSEVCFADCVWDFTTRRISGIENQCSLYCAEKYLKMNQRVSTRFQVLIENLHVLKRSSFLCQEFQMLSSENAMAVVQKSGQL